MNRIEIKGEKEDIKKTWEHLKDELKQGLKLKGKSDIETFRDHIAKKNPEVVKFWRKKLKIVDK